MAIITRLAALSRIKARIGTSETTDDTLLTELLAVSTSIAVQLVGAEIRREADVTLYPSGPREQSRYLYLPRFPIESITSVKQVYTPPEDNDWTDVDALVEHTDYLVQEPGAGDLGNRGKLERINGVWYVGSHLIQVIGTFGFADPASVPEGAITPPEDLQEAIVNDAIQRWTYRNTGGVGDVTLPSGGSYRSKGLKPHESLVDACSKLRRYTL